jgi:hypothetical protein
VTDLRKIQAHLGVPADGILGPDTLAAIAKALGLEKVGDPDLIPDDYWPMLAKIENNNRPYIKSASSSASGLYQFIKSTWIGEGGQWGADGTKAFGASSLPKLSNYAAQKPSPRRTPLSSASRAFRSTRPRCTRRTSSALALPPRSSRPT